MQRILRSTGPTIFAVGTALITLLAQPVSAQQANYPPAVGEMHPDFELPSIDQNTMLQFSNFRGKKLLLFHFASW